VNNTFGKGIYFDSSASAAAMQVVSVQFM